MKAITYGECPNPQVLATLRFYPKKIEQAGKGYEDLKMKMHLIRTGVYKDSDSQKEKNISESKSGNEKDEEEIEIDEEKMKNKKKKKRKASLNLKNNINYYELMGFKDWGEDFSEKLLKKKYMKKALRYHPDKMGKLYDEEAKKRWLMVSLNKIN